MHKSIKILIAGFFVIGFYIFINWQTRVPETKAETKDIAAPPGEIVEQNQLTLSPVKIEKPIISSKTVVDKNNILACFPQNSLGRELALHVINFCSPQGLDTPEVEMNKDPLKTVEAYSEAYFKLPSGNLDCERMFVLENMRIFIESDVPGVNTNSVRSKIKELHFKIVQAVPVQKNADCDVDPMGSVAFTRFLALESDINERTKMANLYLSKCRTQAVKDQVEDNLKMYAPSSEFGVPEPGY